MMSGTQVLHQQKITARIGMVNFINTAPLYQVWQRTVQRPDWQVVEAPPATLNRMLYEDKLDLGFMSSHEYGLHPEKYKILGNLSISATGTVGSVFLFSKLPIDNLGGQKVLLSSQSQTSASLVQIVLEEFYGVQPQYLTGQVLQDRDKLSEVAAVLVIGDEALRMALSEDYSHRIDLAEVWQKHTGLPFVFAVWAVRESFCESDPDTVFAIHQELLRCIEEGKEELIGISRQVAPRIPMSEEECYKYLMGLEYDLNEQKQEALQRFFQYLIQKGEIGSQALPLKICG